MHLLYNLQFLSTSTYPNPLLSISTRSLASQTPFRSKGISLGICHTTTRHSGTAARPSDGTVGWQMFSALVQDLQRRQKRRNYLLLFWFHSSHHNSTAAASTI